MLLFLNRYPPVRRAMILLGLGSALALCVAFISQYAFHMHPCELCLKQRYPYAIVTMLALVGLGLKNGTWKNGERIILLLIVALLIGETGIALYHVGVEHGWWQSGCATTATGNDLNALRESILQAPTVRCDQPALVFLSLSMAAWNTLYAFSLSLFGAAIGYWEYKKAKYEHP